MGFRAALRYNLTRLSAAATLAVLLGSTRTTDISALSPRIALGAGAAGLICSLIPVLRNWLRRRSAWRADPSLPLVEEPPAAPLSQAAALLLVVIAAGATLLALGSAFAAIGAFLAAIAAGATAHALRHSLCDWFASLAIALAVAAIVAAIAGVSPAGTLLALAIAAGHALWLARFWRQQLLGGRAWTTTGRMIPAARGVGNIGPLIGIAFLFADRVSSDALSGVLAVLAGVAWLGLSSLFLRDVLGGQRLSLIGMIGAAGVSVWPLSGAIGGIVGGIAPGWVAAGVAGLLAFRYATMRMPKQPS